MKFPRKVQKDDVRLIPPEAAYLTSSKKFFQQLSSTSVPTYCDGYGQ